MNKRIEMEAVVKSYHMSKLSRQAFSSQEGLSLQKLGYWIHKLAQEQSAGKFITLDRSASSSASDQLELHYPNGIKLKVHNGSISYITQLIKSY